MVVGSALFHSVNGCRAMVQSLPVGTSLLRVPSAAPDIPSGAALYCAVGLSEDRWLSYFSPKWVVGCARRGRSGAVYPLVCLLPRSLSMCARSGSG